MTRPSVAKQRLRSGDEIVRLEDVVHTYPGPPPVHALRGVTFGIRAGEVVAITGVSGSGKSTLLNVIGLLDRPTSGSYVLDGAETGTLSEREFTSYRAERIGFVFQEFHLVRHRTALHNVALPLVYTGESRREQRRRALEALSSVGMAHRAHAVPSHLSGGERQRVAVARAIVAQPSLLLCDEPTGNLDRGNTDQLLELLLGLAGTGVTLILVTHDSRVAESAERRLEIVDGRLSE